MAFTETTTTGYGSRVGSSFKDIGFGLLLLVIATGLLWWNEGRAVKTDKMLDEGQKVCVDMENPNKIDQALEGELVCASALAKSNDYLLDAQYNIGDTAICIRRNVEYFQWVEHAQSTSEDKLGGKEVTTTTYTYTQEWCSRPVDSGQFKDPAYQGKNYTLTAVDESEQWAKNVSFGAYKLNESLIQSISSNEPMVLNFSDAQLQAWEKAVKQVATVKKGLPQPKPSPVEQAVAESKETASNADSTKTVVPDSVPQENKVDLEYIHQMGNVLYYGRVATAPEIGDVRVTFEKVVPAKVTIIAQVTGDTFKPYKAKNGKRFQTLRMGKLDADEIFDAEHEANNIFLWILRIGGVLLVIFAFKMIFGFLETILKVVPFLANIMGYGVGFVCTILGIVWSLIIIAIAWLFYRPLLGIILLAIAGFLIWFFSFKGKNKLIKK